MTHLEKIWHASCTSNMKHCDWLSGRDMELVFVRGKHGPRGSQVPCFGMETNICPEIQRLLRFVGHAVEPDTS